ncbi:MAG: manganese transport protein, partial [Polaribacter sp.]
SYVNSKTQNIFGIIIVIGTIFLGLKGILKVFNVL